MGRTLSGFECSDAGRADPRRRRGSPGVEGRRVGERWGTGRVEAFSDGVFAIAITLLVLDINVPASSFDDLWKAIAHEWPSYLGYVTSFLTIGGIWLAHHGMFRRMRYANTAVMRVNLLLLMSVSFLPFPTRLVGDAVRNTGAERAAVIFYGASLLVCALLLAAIWGVVVRDRSLLRRDVTDAEVNEVLLATSPSVGLYAALTLLAIPAPRVAAFGYLLIGALAVLRARGDSGGGELDTPPAAPGSIAPG